MSILRTLLARLRAHFSEHDHATRLDEEISAHIDALAADYETRGLSPRDAYLAARREFGGIAQMREEHRDQRRLHFADTLAQDVRYAFRQMAAHKAFTAAAILTLALGIGANTAIFEGLTSFVYRPLPVPSPNQLAQIKIVNTSQPTAANVVNPSFSYPAYRDFISRQTIASGIYASGWFQLANADLRISGSTQKARGVLVTGSFFPVLGLRAKIGRVLAPSDDSPSAPLAVVLSDGFWDRAFARNSGAIGQSIEIHRIPATIVGVAPASFKGEILMYEPDFYVPMSATPRVSSAHLLDDRSMSWLSVMARLKPGVSLAGAQSSLEALYRGLPDKESEIHVRVDSGARGIPYAQAQMEQPGLLVMAVAALALLIACCNLANLLLGRAWSRTHEIGVRLAMGAGRARLVRQLFTESLVLALAGGTVAMLVYPWLLRWFGSFAELTIEAPMSGALLTTAICALLCTCVFGLAPALAATRLDFHAALQASRRAQSLAPARNRLGQALVVVQLSVSLLLISGSGLLLRSLWNVSHQGSPALGRFSIHHGHGAAQRLYTEKTANNRRPPCAFLRALRVSMVKHRLINVSGSLVTLALVSYDAILLVSFGGPERREDVLPFLENVLRGRNVPRERMLAVAEHYYHFGGRSPINAYCRALVEELRGVSDLPVYWGNRNWHPMLGDTVAQMAKDGIKHALAIATSAYSSYSSCRQYTENIAAARDAAGDSAPRIDKLPPFWRHPLFVRANAERVRVAFDALQADTGDARLVFTAHSIPASMAAGSKYEGQLREVAAGVAGALGIANWDMAWQSRSGPPSQPWLEPDILEHLRALARSGVKEVVISPIGFLSDHMEVLHDLDIEAKAEAEKLGITLVRAETAGLHPAMTEMFRDLIAQARAGGVAQDCCGADCCLPPARPAGVIRP